MTRRLTGRRHPESSGVWCHRTRHVINDDNDLKNFFWHRRSKNGNSSFAPERAPSFFSLPEILQTRYGAGGEMVATQMYLQVHVGEADEHPGNEAFPKSRRHEAHAEEALQRVGAGPPEAVKVHAGLGGQQVRQQVAGWAGPRKRKAVLARSLANSIFASATYLSSVTGSAISNLASNWKYCSSVSRVNPVPTRSICSAHVSVRGRGRGWGRATPFPSHPPGGLGPG